MAIPESGPLAEYGTIGVELGVAQTNVSIRGMSQTAGFTEPDAFSEFYGYSSNPCTDIVDNYDPFGGNGVALYQLNGDATDVSGNYNATAINVTWGGEGVFGTSAAFNGSSSTIYEIIPVRSVSFWVNLSSTSNIFALDLRAGGGSEYIWFPGYVPNISSGTVYVNGAVSDGSALQENNWYHIAAVFANYTIPNPMYIGRRYSITGPDDWFSGKIDQFRVFNTALTPLEVEALYTEELCICDGTVDTLDILGDGSCIATYQLDGNTNDLSGNYSGTPTDVSYGVGEFDLAGVFNGSSSFINTNYTWAFTSIYAISFWAKTSTINTRQMMTGVLASNGADASGRFGFGFTSSNTFEFYIANGSSFYQNTSISSISYQNNEWHNYIVVVNGTSIKLYIDGNTTPIANLTSTVLGTASSDSLFIGKFGAYPGVYFNGSIDQVRIFNKALSAGEVTTLYNETACTPHINLDRDPVRHWGFDNTLNSTKSGYSPLLKTSASYVTGRFGQALTFARGNTASETSTFYGDIWTDVTKANFLQGSISFWFKPGSVNQRNIVTYCEKIPPFGLEFSTGNKLSITSFLSTDTYSPETYGTSDIIFVCITANRTGGVGTTQTCDFTMYYSSVSENNLKSISNSGTSTESTYTGTFCLGHGAASVGFDGWIDQFRLFDKPLNAEQVQALFDEQPY